MSETIPLAVRRRHVLYIPGYDPFHPRRYRELYRRESALQAAVLGYQIAISPRQGQGPYGWQVAAHIADTDVTTRIDVLVWSDMVKTSMKPSILTTYVLLLRTAWIYLSTGALWRLMRLRKGPIIAALYPVLFLLGQLAIACALAYGAAGLLGRLHWAAPPLALAVIPLILNGFKRLDNKIFAYYLMHDYAYSAQHYGANPPALETRMAAFSDQIEQALHSDVDEVLVVGHSSGAHLGVSVLADLIRAGRVPGDGPALGFLSLGQVVPMVSFLPRAKRLRADLAYLSASAALTWVDVTAPGDGCAFALCDPVAVSGVAPVDKRWPLVISAAFSQTLGPAVWAKKRWKFFQLHFQYLCAFDRPNGYDYFQITAGPQTLAARFHGRAPSQSRIAYAVSGYRSMVA